MTFRAVQLPFEPSLAGPCSQKVEGTEDMQVDFRNGPRLVKRICLSEIAACFVPYPSAVLAQYWVGACFNLLWMMLSLERDAVTFLR